MKNHSSATIPGSVAAGRDSGTGPGVLDGPDGARPRGSEQAGVLLAALGVLSFSFTFPATVWASEGFGAWTTTGARGVVAGSVAVGCLLLTRSRLPRRAHWPALACVAFGCVLGFPLLTTLALQTSTSAHSAIVIGLLPLATAALASWRTRQRQRPAFWAAAAAGAAVVLAFTLAQSHGRPTIADLYLVGALLLCAAGYAEGGRIAPEVGGWQVIGWAVVLALPVTVPITLVALATEPVTLSLRPVVGLGYLSLVSQFGGFVLWYRGMALIGVARASQLQLAQPLLTLVWAALVLGETLTPLMPVAGGLVLACVVVTQRVRA